MYTLRGTKKTYPTEREVRKIIIDSKVPATVGGNVSCLEGISVKLVKVYVYRSGYIMVYMIIWYVCKYMTNYMISEDDTYLRYNMIPHTVGLRKEQYIIQIQYLFRFF